MNKSLSVSEKERQVILEMHGGYKNIIKEQNTSYTPSRGLKDSDLLDVYMNGDKTKKVQVLVKEPFGTGEQRARFIVKLNGQSLEWVGPYDSKTLEFNDTKGNKYKVVKIYNAKNGNEIISVEPSAKPTTPPAQPKKNLLLPPETIARLQNES